jgi:hypothetical protein
MKPWKAGIAPNKTDTKRRATDISGTDTRKKIEQWSNRNNNTIESIVY